MQRFGKVLPLMVVAVMVGLGFSTCKTDETDTDSGNSNIRGVRGIVVQAMPTNLQIKRGEMKPCPSPPETVTSSDVAFLTGLRVEVVLSDGEVMEFTLPDQLESFKTLNGTGKAIFQWNHTDSPVTVDISAQSINQDKAYHAYVTITVKELTSFKIEPPPNKDLIEWYRLGDDGIKGWFTTMIGTEGGTIKARYGAEEVTISSEPDAAIPFNNINVNDIDFDGFDKDIVGVQSVTVKLFDVKSANSVKAVVLPVLSDNKYTAMQTIPSGTVQGAIVGSNGAFRPDVFTDVLGGRLYTIKRFEMGKYEIPNALWYGVGKWAAEKQASKYTFNSLQNAPSEEQRLKPAQDMTWIDAAVWCNAYTELMNEFQSGNIPYPPDDHNTLANVLNKQLPELSCVYLVYDNIYTTPLRDGTVTSDGLIYDPTTGTLKKFVIDHRKNGFRLPDEAEWEWAARGGQYGTDTWGFTYAGSNDPTNVAGDSSGTHAIGTKAAIVGNKNLDIYDMTGNVWEWCIKLNPILAGTGELTWGTSYNGTPVPDVLARTGLGGSENYGVAKGASFEYQPSLSGSNDIDQLKLNNASRSGLTLSTVYRNTGFRIVRSSNQ
ncbi:MAG: formylglycine-generating enzyme family protein [Spirochaetaceae bacterium]|jgi:formylglycine-generating enzyme required for sulfatase activity|nr:formylglycine-generating enzyme family protein [Spirochaetaceae bacterium]